MMFRLPFVYLLLVAGSIGGCSYTTVELTRVEESPFAEPPTLIVGKIEGNTDNFRRGLLKDLKSAKGLLVVEDAHGVPSQNKVILRGQFTDNLEELEWEDLGDDPFWKNFGRKTLGMGVGKTMVFGEFTLHGPGGEELLRFKAIEHYGGGSGAGGAWDYPAMAVGSLKWGGEMMFSSLAMGFPMASSPLPLPVDFIGVATMERRLGDEVGETVRRWYQGELPTDFPEQDAPMKIASSTTDAVALTVEAPTPAADLALFP